MMLYHYTEQPLKFTPEYVYHKRIGKPAGFWVTDDTEYNWDWWCRMERFRYNKYRYIVDTSGLNMLKISTMDQMVELNNRLTENMERFVVRGRTFFDDIDWCSLRSEYDGVIISPYQWEACDVLGRHDMFWYYTWDCASGVIWSTGKIVVKKDREYVPEPFPEDEGW